MRLLHDPAFLRLGAGLLAILLFATITGQVLARRAPGDTVANLNARIRAWWVMVTVFTVSVLVGNVGSLILFGLVSFLALREFITLAPTSSGDHQALFWSFFLVVPLQYVLVGVAWYGLFSILIPVYAFLLLSIRSVLAGETSHFLERVASIQWALMVCVYCVSYAPALLNLRLPGFAGQGAKLLLFLVIVVQISDVAQYLCGKLFGRHRLSPLVSPNKTWEGLIGGGLIAVGVGTATWWATPFGPAGAAGMALLVVVMGAGGGLVMSGIKRSRGVKDFGATIPGHGGILDRIDSLSFAAPLFFHLSRFFFHGA